MDIMFLHKDNCAVGALFFRAHDGIELNRTQAGSSVVY